MKIVYFIIKDIILLLLASWAIYLMTHKEEIIGVVVKEYIEYHDLIQYEI